VQALADQGIPEVALANDEDVVSLAALVVGLLL